MSKRLILFGCVLLAATVAANAQQPGVSDVENVLDHFNCYFAPAPVQPKLLFLRDQFDAARETYETVQDLRLALFCNPVQKVLVGSTAPKPPLHHADAHLAMYLTDPQPATPRLVEVNNQFGIQWLQTGKAELLAVPTGKLPVPSTSTAILVQVPAIPNPNELNHFRCYAASGQPINKPVTLFDQFFVRGTSAKVLQPVFFCNPVAKGVPHPTSGETLPGVANSVTGINEGVAGAAHLTCYLKTPNAFQGVVIYNNQFVPEATVPTLAIRNSEILCVPSVKVTWCENTTAGSPTNCLPPAD